MQIPFVGFQPVQSSEHMAVCCIVVWGLTRLMYYCVQLTALIKPAGVTIVM